MWMKKICWVSCLAVFTITLAGCNIPSKTVSTNSHDQVMTIVASQLTEIALKTAVAPKIHTVSPPPSATAKPTETPVQVVTPSLAAPSVNFTGHQVYIAYLEGGVLQVSITVPGGIKGDYSATFDGKPYACFTYTSKSLDRLICHGALLKSETSYKFQIFAKGSEIPIFERMVTVPLPQS